MKYHECLAQRLNNFVLLIDVEQMRQVSHSVGINVFQLYYSIHEYKIYEYTQLGHWIGKPKSECTPLIIE